MRQHQQSSTSAADKGSIGTGGSASINSRSSISSSSPAQRVVAATAGVDSWKTWSGRSHGTNDDFEIFDLWRGMKRTIQHKFGSKGRPPPVGANCPVCLCPVDDEKEEINANGGTTTSSTNHSKKNIDPSNSSSTSQWHVTWCGCAVCKSCMKGYVQSQIRDVEHNGVLKCPVCTKDLRKLDAMAALDGDEQLILEWDTKIRNNLLRALPSYRPCPRCSNAKNTNQSEGGGFVTPDCLAPHYYERRSNATQVLNVRYVAPLAVLLVYFGFVWFIAKTPSRSALVDLFFMLAPVFIFIKFAMATQLWVATQARTMFFRPIQVGCPCCNEPFILPAEVNSTIYHDEQTNEWMKSNTRPCPSCSVPISKVSGCNHMKCSHCGAQFCWACMRLRTSCRAYRCNNRAPFGDAIPEPQENNDNGHGRHRRRRRQLPPRPNDSVLSIIDYLLDRPYPQIGYKDGIFLVGCIVARHIKPVEVLVHHVMSVVASVLSTNTVLGFGVWYLLRVAFTDFREWQLQQQQQQQQHQHVPDLQVNQNLGRFVEELIAVAPQQQQQRHRNLNARQLHRVEQDMVAEAIRRSIQDQ
jgi:IBR domain, a half RING-finger domain